MSVSHRWYHTVGALLFAAFSLEIGIFLMVFPWSSLWYRNWLSSLGPEWYGVWVSPYFRGAVSGLGIADIYIALHEVTRLFRFSIK